MNLQYLVTMYGNSDGYLPSTNDCSEDAPHFFTDYIGIRSFCFWQCLGLIKFICLVEPHTRGKTIALFHSTNSIDKIRDVYFVLTIFSSTKCFEICIRRSLL